MGSCPWHALEAILTCRTQCYPQSPGVFLIQGTIAEDGGPHCFVHHAMIPDVVYQANAIFIVEVKKLLPPQLITEDHNPRLPQIKLMVYCQRSDPQDLAQMVVQELLVPEAEDRTCDDLDSVSLRKITTLPGARMLTRHSSR
jgi:hypothetical protein